MAAAETGAGVRSQTTPVEGAAGAPATGSGSASATARSESATPRAPLPPTQAGPSSPGSPATEQRPIPSGPSAPLEAGPRSVRNYGGGMVLGVPSAVGWAAGKLLERAAGAISEPPTTESLLAGLWTIKGDNLGGLTPPLTFVKDQPPARVTCWFNLTVAQRAWVSPDGFKLHCQDRFRPDRP